MHLRRAHRWAVLGAVVSAACASTTTGDRCESWERTVPLPPDTVAAIAAGALRQVLPFADPVRSERGAPVQRLDCGAFRIAFARQSHGDWIALATHRLTIGTADDRAGAALIVTCEQRGDPATAGAAANCDLIVRGSPDGAVVHGTLPAELVPAVEQALALAADPRASLPGLAEPNLATLVVHRLRAEALRCERDGDRNGARELRQRAARLGTPSAPLHRRLGDEAALAGDAAGAHEHYWRALGATADPRLRADLAQRLTALPAPEATSNEWRRAARAALHAEDAPRALRLLHTARRRFDEPALDYGLASQMHHRGGAEFEAFASALLAREHAGERGSLAVFTSELWRTLPLSPAVARTPAQASTNAVDPRPAPALAMPPR